VTRQGQWVESQDLVELTPDGSAAAVRGPMKAYFNPNLNTAGAITFNTASNRVFRTRPLAIVFYDASSGATALVAPLQDCVGELLSPNQIVYKSAFGPLADIRLTYTKAAIESDLVLLQQPKIPDGWDPRTTRLELWHEWLDAPTPRQNPRLLYRETDPALRSQMLEPDLTDEMLSFGELLFPTGAAYWTDGSAPQGTNAPVQVRAPNLSREVGLVPVAKTWLTTPNLSLLIEAVRWKDLQPMLRNLPAAGLNDRLGFAQDRLTLLRQLPAPAPSRPAGTAIKLASTSYHPAACVWDYITVSYPFANYTYATGTTYYVTGGGCIDGSTFSPGCVFKFAPGAGGFLIYGYYPITFNGSSSSPVILTAWNDDSFGERINGSDGSPSPNSSYGIYVYYADHAVTLSGLRIRWAQTGVQFDANDGSSFTHTFADSLLEFCEYGLFVNNYATVSVENSKQCGVSYPESGYNYDSINNFSGALQDVCSGDADNNGLPDAWEYWYFGHIGVNTNADSDGDGLTNYDEWLYGTNPTLQDSDSDGIVDGTVLVTNIKFNYDTGSSDYDGINIRQDYDTPLNLANGEWVKDSLNQPVCYRANRSVRVQARISIEGPLVSSAMISATSSDADGSLGNVNATTVNFVNGVSSPEYVTLYVAGATPNCIKKTTTDLWQWKSANVNGSASGERNMNISGPHTVYTILSQPITPVLEPCIDEGLDCACVWANGQTTANGAAEALLANGFAQHYSWNFDCHRLSSDFARMMLSLGNNVTQHTWASTGGPYQVGDMVKQRTIPFDPVGVQNGPPPEYRAYEWYWHQWSESGGYQRDPSAAFSLAGNWGAYEDYLFSYYEVKQPDLSFAWEANHPGQSIGCEYYHYPGWHCFYYSGELCGAGTPICGWLGFDIE
jgi:hypothetical protein